MVRIDIELVNKGIFESRSKAQNEIKMVLFIVMVSVLVSHLLM